MDALRIWGRAFGHLNQRGYIYIWGNLWCVILSLPIITAPAAWAGLIKMTCRAYATPAADLNDFWSGFRENLRRGLVVGLLNLAIIGVNLANLFAYGGQTDTFASLLRLVWIMALLVWFALQAYLWPIFYEMEQPSVLGALRNAAIMIYLNPLFTGILWLVALPILVLSSYVVALWILLTISLLAIVSVGAVFDRLQRAGHQIATDVGMKRNE